METTTNIIKGITIAWKHGNWLLVDAQFVNPGKGSAFTRCKLKNLKTGQVIENTFRSGEKVDVVETVRKKAQYLYNDGTDYHFMDNESYEQFSLSAESLSNNIQYLIDDIECYALYIENQVVSIQLPAKMEFTVTSTPPGCKGDTATGGSKEAVIETGKVIKVPLFIKEQEKIIVNTEDGSYAGKA